MEFAEVNPYLRSTGYIQWCYNDPDPSISYDMRIFAIYKNDACLTLGKTQYHLKEGSVVLLAPGTPYHFHNFDSSAPFDMYCASYDITQEYRNSASYIHPVYAPLFRPDYIIDRKIVTNERDISNFHFPLVLSGVPSLCHTAKEIHRECETKEPFYLERCSGLLKSALFSALRASESAAAPNTANSAATAQQVMRYIEKNFRQPINEQSIADELNFHPYYLARLTNRYFGTTPFRYLTECRIKEAVRLLLSTDRSVAEIAEACGFSTPSHFSTVFRRSVGMAPGVYRKNMRGDKILKMHEAY